MATTEQEREIIKALMTLTDASSTHLLPTVGTAPVSNYASTEQFQREREILFRHFPLALAHSSALAAPGDFLTHDDTGVPILLARGRDGKARAFLNVCRHRGARLTDQPCGKTGSFTCPYHSWSYGLTGELRGLPQPEGFAGIDRSALGLRELQLEERYGFLWVVPSPNAPRVAIDAWLAPMAEQFETLEMESHVVFKQWKVERQMNWRLALEGFQESYHFCHAHRESACAGYLDNQSLHLNLKPHVRHAVPLPKFLEMKEQPEEAWDYRTTFMTQNYLFPANFVQVMTDHIYLHTIIPLTPHSCTFQCIMLIPEAPQSDKAARYWQKNYEVVKRVFDEDFTIGEGIQKGLLSGANENFTFGRYECGLHFGAEAIDQALKGELTPPQAVDLRAAAAQK